MASGAVLICRHTATRKGTHLPEKSEKAEADMNIKEMTPHSRDEIVCNCCQAMIQIHWLIVWLIGTQSCTLQCHFSSHDNVITIDLKKNEE